jgi:hypothetical protein
VLRLLLRLPYSPSRRGKVYERLTLDLAHQSRHKACLDACWAALTDPATGRPARLGIGARMLRLIKQVR